ncbi:YrhB domain-containing protein [Thalassobius sp. I31.1]|uniref:YrhB domain-containing protein n=1 Tax=Thalassobius sp. I31.1 TaxID=2109912 RepID=UPI000D1A1463|nr:YrhB domain-containing protein [Thalassobius sp. I31.1]
MLTYEQGKVLAGKQLETLFCEARLCDEPYLAGEYGWVFSYQSEAFMRTGELQDALVGNAPILVDKNTHDVHVLGTGLPAECYVENYIACGDPYKFLGKRVLLTGWQHDAQKIKAFRVIRKNTDLSMTATKSCVEDCVRGNQVEIECDDVLTAERLASSLSELGLYAEQIRE